MGAGGRRRTGRFIGNYIRSNELGDGPQASHRYSFLADQTVPINQKDVKGHYGCVNAIEASSDEQYLTSGGDDHRVLLWSICDVQTRREPKPIAVMRQLHSSNIFSLAFSNEGDRIYSAGNDALLLVHDIATGNMIDWFKTDQAIYNVSTNPIDDSVIISASQDGRVRLHDLRTSEETITARSQGTMYCAQFNPRRPNLISVCSETDGLTIHDRRKFERPCVRLGLSQKSLLGICSSVMYGQWSSNGEGIFATRNQNCPIYYDLNDGSFVEFKDPNYRNSCTVKSCSFITDDLVMTGSDDWNIYVWKLPQNVSGEQTIDKAYRVLEGHRSIVNHARYSALNRMIFSSGVEKIIKLWSEWELNGSYRNPNRRFLLLGHQPRQSRSEESVEEDLTMLAFFDRLTTVSLLRNVDFSFPPNHSYANNVEKTHFMSHSCG
ncbi:hypothetical protein AB6A40_010367 [Gnathostoma spinigerum]|uniref:Uncharacterized protein n=1 Tax=Gnathostoma spinigerum TaxID=75299 RepID=A0ABD6EV26_9BILA